MLNRQVMWLHIAGGAAAAVLLALAASLRAADGPQHAPWFEHSLVGMEVGPTGAQFGHSDRHDPRYCARMDGAEIVRRAVAAHCQYLVLWARDGDWAYYNSKLLPKAPGLGKRDPLRDACAEAKKHGLPLIAYCVVQQDGNYLDDHPQFRARAADGKPINRFCLNSGYLEVMKQILAEELAYGIDGFHVDMLDQGFGPPYGCWCDACRQQFEAEFHHPMPKGATWDSAWDDMLEFRYRSSQRFEKALAAYVRCLNPHASIDFNYHGNPPFSWEVGQRPVQHAGNADFVTGETGMWGFSALGVGLNAEFYRAATPGRPYQVAISRDARIYHNQTVRPLNDLRWELFTLLAHGCFVTVVDKMGFDGWLDPMAYDRAGAAFAEARAQRANFGQEPVYDVGIYFSSRTRDWVGRENAARYFHAFQGAHKACVYEHLGFGVLLDENLSLDGLRQFPVVCLPNVGILSNEEIALFRRYVEQGGKLIVTGQSGQFDRVGRPRAESALSELIGAKTQHRLESADNWVRFPASVAAPVAASRSRGLSQFSRRPCSARCPTVKMGLSPLGRALRRDWPFLVQGPAVIYAPTTAESFGQLLKPFRTIRQQEGKEGTDWPMSPDSPVGPAVLVNRLGKGTVLTFACSPDCAVAGEHHIVEDRKLFSNAVRWLEPAPRVEITAPATVESVVTDDPAEHTLRIHFIAYNAPPQTTPERNRPYVLPALIEDTPIFRAAITTREPITGVRALNPKTQVRHDAHHVEATIEDIHEVLLLHYSKAETCHESP